MGTQYDAEHTRRYYDALAAGEWVRFERDAPGRVNFHVHCHYLRQFVKAGDVVLDVGAGPGRFTIELARLGATVTVGDLSPVQLALNREKVREAGYEHAITSREIMDITDLFRLPVAHFDATVCYGAPLNYTFDRADDAVAGLVRTTKPGGHLLVSVASLFGTLRRFMPAILDLAREQGADVALQQVIKSGNLSGETNNGHALHLYQWDELRTLLERHGCQIVVASAANFLSPNHAESLMQVMDDPELWAHFLDAEVEACRQPGALDGGTHIIAVVQRR